MSEDSDKAAWTELVDSILESNNTAFSHMHELMGGLRDVAAAQSSLFEEIQGGKGLPAVDAESTSAVINVDADSSQTESSTSPLPEPA